VAALLFSHFKGVDLNVVHGRVIVQDGQLTTIDVPNWLKNIIGRRAAWLIK
jgi:hypothetical protein